MSGHTTAQCASTSDEQETVLQNKYMKEAEVYVNKLSRQLGRRPLCCVTTFGCQVNAVHGI